MLRLLGAAALAFTAASPVLSQGKSHDNPGKGADNKPAHAAVDRQSPDQAKGQGKGKGNDHSNGYEQPAKADNPNRGPAAVVSKQRRDSEKMSRGASKRDDVRGDRAIAERMQYRDGGRSAPAYDRQNRDRDDRFWVERDRFYTDVPSCPPGLAKKNNGCLPPGFARQARDQVLGFGGYRPSFFGIPLRGTTDYEYYDGYLIPSGNGGHFLPLLGGALAVGQLWPEAYPSLRLNDWQQDYYGFDDSDGYRYADNVVYRVDPGTSAIESIVALLTGSDFAVGERLPAGYDVYNVPAAYRGDYYDTDDSLYRYADGQVLQVDPTTMLIQQIIELII